MKRDDRTINILLSGVGGQGILLASELIARAALFAAYDVKKSEVHGLAQRGGSVESHVRFGKRVFSPLVPMGEADILLSFEKAEAIRWAHYLKQGEGIAVVNDVAIIPVQVVLGIAEYPENIGEILEKRASHVFLVNAYREATKLGNPKVFNTFLVGVLSNFVPLPENVWRRAIEETVPPTTVEINIEAFIAGKRWVGTQERVPT